MPEIATHDEAKSVDNECIYLWMSDYHPDGGQLFWSLSEVFRFQHCITLSSALAQIKFIFRNFLASVVSFF